MSDEVAWAALIVSVVAAIPLYVDLVWRYTSVRSIEFEIEKFYEPNEELVPSLYSVRILHPTKVIEHCKVYFENEALAWWDSPKGRPNYDHKLGASGGGNVRVPETTRAAKPDGLVVVMDGNRTLRKIKFEDIPRGK